MINEIGSTQNSNHTNTRRAQTTTGSTKKARMNKKLYNVGLLFLGITEFESVTLPILIGMF
jgi:hypothetical protein